MRNLARYLRLDIISSAESHLEWRGEEIKKLRSTTNEFYPPSTDVENMPYAWTGANWNWFVYELEKEIAAKAA